MRIINGEEVLTLSEQRIRDRRFAASAPITSGSSPEARLIDVRAAIPPRHFSRRPLNTKKHSSVQRCPPKLRDLTEEIGGSGNRYRSNVSPSWFGVRAVPVAADMGVQRSQTSERTDQYGERTLTRPDILCNKSRAFGPAVLML